MYQELTTAEVEKLKKILFIITNREYKTATILDYFKKYNKIILQYTKFVTPTMELNLCHDILITRKNIYYHFGRYKISYICLDNNKPTKNLIHFNEYYQAEYNNIWNFLKQSRPVWMSEQTFSEMVCEGIIL